MKDCKRQKVARPGGNGLLTFVNEDGEMMYKKIEVETGTNIFEPRDRER